MTVRSAAPRAIGRGIAPQPESAWSRRRAARRLLRAAPLVFTAPLRVFVAAAYPAADRAARRLRVRRAISDIAARLLHALGIEVTIVGSLPPSGALLVANHISWLDVLALAAHWPTLGFVAKREVAAWPLIGPVVRAAETTLVDRARKRDLRRVIPSLAAAFAEGAHVCLFAEGTTTDGSAVRPFKSSLFEAAVRSGAPVVPLAIRAWTPGDAPAAATYLCWHGETTLLAHLPRVAGLRRARLTVQVGAPIVARSAGITRPAEAVRKPLARSARLAVVALLGIVPRS